MKLLVSPSNQDYILALYDAEQMTMRLVPAEKKHEDHRSDTSRPPVRPYGITWDSENVFVASRSNLIVLDKDYGTVDVVKGILDQNTHQIAHKDGVIVSTMTRCDCISFIDLNEWSKRYFHPHHGWISGRPRDLHGREEKHHINSVVWKGDLVYILLNNRGRGNSRVAVLDMRTELTEWVTDLDAIKAHGLYVSPDGLGTLDTGGRRDLVQGKKRTSLYVSEQGYCRGLAGNKETLFCGHFKKPHHWGEGGSILKIVTDGVLSGSRILDGIGAINDIRLIDDEDFCHWNEDKFPACTET